MKHETMIAFINCSRSLCKHQAKGTLPTWRTAPRQESERMPGFGEEPGSSGQGAPEAEVLPHALKRKTSKKAKTQGTIIVFRLSEDFKRKIREKTKSIETTLSKYIVGLIVHDLGLPVDEFAVARNLDLRKAFERNSLALNRVGNQLDKIAAIHSEANPLTRAEIKGMLADHAAACRAHLAMGHHL